MKIIYIEPFYSGAHKQWIDSYKQKSAHDIEILTLPGNKWKWRMHGGAITLANKFLNYIQLVMMKIYYKLNLLYPHFLNQAFFLNIF